MFRRFPFSSRLVVLSCALALAACDDDPVLFDDAGTDAMVPPADAGPNDDAGLSDAGPMDGGSPTDGGVDAGPPCEELEPTVPLDPTSGTWHPEFSNPGVSGGTRMHASVAAFAFSDDGRLYVGGNFTTAGYTPASNVAAWDPANGWSALGEGLTTAVTGLAVDSDGSLYAVHADPDAEPAVPAHTRISRWDGTSWTTFAKANGVISEIEAFGDYLIAVGDFTEIGGAAHDKVAYYDGTEWRGFAGLIPDKIVQSISAISLDDICIGGQFNDLGTIEAQSVACWDGSSWSARSLPPPPDLPRFPPQPGVWNVNDLQRDPDDGSLVAAGDFRLDLTDVTTGGGIARWTGSEWELIGDGLMENSPGSAGNVNAIVFAPSGLYAGGTFRYANASFDPLTEVNDVARWDGTRWHAMGQGLFAPAGFGIGGRTGAVGVIAATPDGGSIFFGGAMHRADTMAVGGVVRWDGTYWRRLGAPDEVYHGISGDALAFARRGTCEVYVGGDFAYAGDVRANSIARFTWEDGYEPLGEGLLGAVQAIQVTRAGLVYVGGNFTDPSGTALRNLAMWDGSEWHDVGGGVGDPTDPFQTVRALAIAEGAGHEGADLVYVAGQVTMAGGERFSGFGMWTGSEWVDLGASMEGHPGADPRVTSLLIDPESGDLIVAGSFTAVGEGDARIETTNVARWDGTAWHAYGNGIGDRDSPISAATLWNGRLVVARHYANDDPLLIAAWNGTEWEAIGTDQPPFTIPGALAGIGDALFAAGNWNAGKHVAVFDGAAWHTLGGGVSDIASAVLPIEGGVLFGGSFNRAGETGSGGIAFWKYAE